jgi:hypothetical protein
MTTKLNAGVIGLGILGQQHANFLQQRRLPSSW